MANALLMGIGLAIPAGLNAFLPLLVVAIAGRFSNFVTLGRPYEFVGSTWAIGLITFFLTIEIIVDKIPGLDHANDFVQSALRPAAGAFAMMIVCYPVTSINPVVAMVLGLCLAGAVHAAKATFRPRVTAATGGLANPIISLVEDAAVALTAIVAVVAPKVVLVVLVPLAVLLIWAYRRLASGRSRSTLTVAATLRR